MRQIFQNLKTGEISQPELPVPAVKAGHLLIQSHKSLISLGTEKMLLNFGKANWINKARQQPDKVQQVIQKIRTDGLQPTVKAVFNKLDQPLPLGYSSVGTVIAVGTGVQYYHIGDRVISNGPHAEIVCVAENLCAKVPDNVDDSTAAFTVVSAIGLQGIRLLQPTLGEIIVVTGLGLIGLLCCQLLQANGCRVIGFDYDVKKIELAREFGVEAWDLNSGVDSVAVVLAATDGNGADGILITAATTSNEPIEQAPKMCRKRGRVVLVGVVGLQLNRTEFFQKEVSFHVSCSYGPGRYDENYEQKGMNYPIGFVRWTEQRNFQAVLQLMAEEKISIKKLITQEIPFDQAIKVYQQDHSQSLGILFDYPKKVNHQKNTIFLQSNPKKWSLSSKVRIGAIGAGSFAGSTLFPALKKTQAQLVVISSTSGSSGNHLGKKFQFGKNTTDYKTLLQNDEVNTVIITTQHNSHTKFVCESLQAGKHVFVEKPLAMNREELQQIEDIYQKKNNLHLLVGFNRRFSPHALKMKQLLESRISSLSMVMTVNAGQIPADHWTQDLKRGGGRIIGEGCHFIDLLMFLVGQPIISVFAMKLGTSADQVVEDKMSIQLMFADGSIGTIHYFSNGSKDIPKERLEVFSDGRVLQLDNFKKLTGFGFKNFKKMTLVAQDKGHNYEMKSFVCSVEEGTPSPISFEELKNVTLASFAAVESAEQQKLVTI
ncbi:MAG: Gfo/Idh/MocA family oxidoreductase [Crocinitomicaceae bacterium]|nr:Gfo/Idh/MocA family oxidoreductase [Crocinitomicaceae bacterium]